MGEDHCFWKKFTTHYYNIYDTRILWLIFGGQTHYNIIISGFVRIKRITFFIPITTPILYTITINVYFIYRVYGLSL